LLYSEEKLRNVGNLLIPLKKRKREPEKLFKVLRKKLENFKKLLKMDQDFLLDKIIKLIFSLKDKRNLKKMLTLRNCKSMILSLQKLL
jgi:hypothetical protein